jgi:penicillin-binding protein 2
VCSSDLQTPGGTAYAIFRDAPYTVAGKTGSAQVAGLKQDEKVAPTQESLPMHLRDHALFVAFAPAEDPQIAVGIIAEHGGHGSSVAAPVARQIMDQYLLGEIRYRRPGTPATPAATGPAPVNSSPQGAVAPEPAVEADIDPADNTTDE